MTRSRNLSLLLKTNDESCGEKNDCHSLIMDKRREREGESMCVREWGWNEREREVTVG